jgi:hypothetical protein
MQNITIRQDDAKGRSDVFLGKTVSAVAEVSQSLGLAWNGIYWFLTLTSTKLLKTQTKCIHQWRLCSFAENILNKRSVISLFKV